MYQNFFRLKTAPFNNSPDPNFLLMLPQVREALAGLRFGITNRKGMIVLTGPIGTGKTTLLNSALATLDRTEVLFAFVFNPRLDVLDFLEFILSDFGLVPVSRTKSAMLLQLNRWLVEQYTAGRICVVVVDEAHHLSWELLEEIRLLTNLETSSEKILQIILSAQPELEDILRQPNARQLRQRIALSLRTAPLTAEQTAAYIASRLQKAALDGCWPEPVGSIFPARIARKIYEATGGVPRLINLVCEHCLILAYVEDRLVVTEGIVDAVLDDTELQIHARADEEIAHPASPKEKL